MYPEESTYWGYAVYQYGTLIETGPNPIPDSTLKLATEIRWVLDNPATIIKPEPTTT